MKKIFEIEWPDKYGSEWLDSYKLESCMFTDSHVYNCISDAKVIVRDITKEQNKRIVEYFKEFGERLEEELNKVDSDYTWTITLVKTED